MEVKDYIQLFSIFSILLLNIFQSIKSGHFKSKCGSIELEHEINVRTPLKPTDKEINV